MPDQRSINIGRDANGNVLNTGDRNHVSAQIAVSLPPPNSVDIAHELTEIRSVLARIGSEHADIIGRAMDDASAELHNSPNNKDEIGAALGRALDYAKKSRSFADEIGKLAPHVLNAAAWLGTNWYKLLGVVGLVI